MKEGGAGRRETEVVQQIIDFDNVCYRIHAASVPSSNIPTMPGKLFYMKELAGPLCADTN